jgi:hypothetical protein
MDLVLGRSARNRDQLGPAKATSRKADDTSLVRWAYPRPGPEQKESAKSLTVPNATRHLLETLTDYPKERTKNDSEQRCQVAFRKQTPNLKTPCQAI